MPQFPLSPGVYVDEVSNFDFGLGQNASAVPVLLTSPESVWWHTQQQPVLIRSLQDYLSLESGGTGAASGLSLTAASDWLGTRASPSTIMDTPYAPQYASLDSLEALALRAYFANGGSACYLCPVDQLEQIAALQDVSLVVQAGQSQAVIADILTLCQPATGRFALLDGPQHTGFYSAAVLQKYLAAIAPTASAALYYPWLNARWQLEEFKGSVGTYAIPPSAVAAGLMMATDNQEGPWRACANLPISNGLTPQVKVGDAGQREFTSQNFTAPSVNMFREFPGKGSLLSGARTLTNSGPAWGYINVRRTFDRVERDLQQSMQRFLFKPNGPASWEALRAAVDNYLYGLFRQQAFAGQSPQTSYRIDIGLGSTMTQQDIQAGVLRMRIGLAVVKPAEFVFLEFSQLLGGASLAGEVGLPEAELRYRLSAFQLDELPESPSREPQPVGMLRCLSMGGSRLLLRSSSFFADDIYEDDVKTNLMIYQRGPSGWGQEFSEVIPNSYSSEIALENVLLSPDGNYAFYNLRSLNRETKEKECNVFWSEVNDGRWPPLSEWKKITLPDDADFNMLGVTMDVYNGNGRWLALSAGLDDGLLFKVLIFSWKDGSWLHHQTLNAGKEALYSNLYGWVIKFNSLGNVLAISSPSLIFKPEEMIRNLSVENKSRAGSEYYGGAVEIYHLVDGQWESLSLLTPDNDDEAAFGTALAFTDRGELIVSSSSIGFDEENGGLAELSGVLYLFANKNGVWQKVSQFEDAPGRKIFTGYQLSVAGGNEIVASVIIIQDGWDEDGYYFMTFYYGVEVFLCEGELLRRRYSLTDDASGKNEFSSNNLFNAGFGFGQSSSGNNLAIFGGVQLDDKSKFARNKVLIYDKG